MAKTDKQIWAELEQNSAQLAELMKQRARILFDNDLYDGLEIESIGHGTIDSEGTEYANGLRHKISITVHVFVNMREKNETKSNQD